MTAPGDRRVLAAIAVALASVWIVIAIWLPFARLWYPFEVEWMGGAFADHVARILDGRPIYVEPTPDFVPYLYTPLYMYLSAGMSLLIGEGLPALRAVSILASLINLTLIFALVRGRTRSNVAAILAVGSWSGCYFVVETWYDAERVDSTFLCFVLATVWTLQRGTRARSAALAGLLMVLAYMTKQTALLLVPSLALFAALRYQADALGPRAVGSRSAAVSRGLVFALSFTLPWFAATSWMDAATDGWFSFYTWRLPREHQFIAAPLLNFWTADSRTLWPALTATLWYFVRSPRVNGWRNTLADGALFGGMLAAGLASRMHVGGAVNVLMPTFFGIAAMAGMAWHCASALPRATERQLLRCLLLLQLVGFAFKFGNSDQPRDAALLDLGEYLPSAADARAGHKLVDLLREADGDVIVPFHGYLPRMAGKRGSAHAMALIDIRGEGISDLHERLMGGFWSSARDRKADLVVLDENLNGMGELIWPGYVAAGRLTATGDMHTFMPAVGLKTRPIILFRRAKQ